MITRWTPQIGLAQSVKGDLEDGCVELQDADLTQPDAVMRGTGSVRYDERWREDSNVPQPLANVPEAVFYRDEQLYAVWNRTLSMLTETLPAQAFRDVGHWYPWRLRALVCATLGDEGADAAVIQPTPGRYFVVVAGVDLDGSSDGGEAVGKVLALEGDTLTVVRASQPIDATVYDGTRIQVMAPRDQSYARVFGRDVGGNLVSSAWDPSQPASTLLAAPGAPPLTPDVAAPAAAFSGTYSVCAHPADASLIVITTYNAASTRLEYRTIDLAGTVTLVATHSVTVPATTWLHTTELLNSRVVTAYTDGTDLAVLRLDQAFAVSVAETTHTPTNSPLKVSAHFQDFETPDPDTITILAEMGTGDANNPQVEYFSATGIVLIATLDATGTPVRQLRAALGGYAASLRHDVAADGVLPVAPMYAVGDGAVLDLVSPATEPLGPLMLVDAARTELLDAPSQAPGQPRYAGRLLSDDKHNGRLDITTLLPNPSYPDRDASGLPGNRVAWLVHASLDTGEPCVKLVLVDATPRAGSPAQIREAVIGAAAGYPRLCDQDGAHEADWHVLPSLGVAESTAGSSGFTPPIGSSFGIAVTFAHEDAANRTWRSAPTIATITTTLGSTDSFNVTYWPTQFTERPVTVIGQEPAPHQIRVEIWRTLTNSSGPYYLAEAIKYESPRNDPANIAITVNIDKPDATLEAGGIILEQAPQGPSSNGVLPHRRARVTDWAVHAAGRVWSPDVERADVLRYSIADRDGFGVGWEDTQIVQVQNAGQRLVAAGEIDGRIVALAYHSAHQFSGEGPDPTGAGAFGQPAEVRIFEGPADASLVTPVPAGLAYVTSDGLRLLDRGLADRDVTGPMTRYFRYDGPSPRALSYHPRDGELLVGSAVGRSVRLHMDTGRWCADSARQALDVAVSSVGRCAYLLTDGAVIELTDDTLVEGDGELSFALETPTLWPDGAIMGRPYDLQAVWVHLYGLAVTSVIIDIIDAETKATILAAPRTYTVVAGSQSIRLGESRHHCHGHRVRITHAASVPNQAAIVAIESQVEITSEAMASLPNGREL